MHRCAPSIFINLREGGTRSIFNAQFRRLKSILTTKPPFVTRKFLAWWIDMFKFAVNLQFFCMSCKVEGTTETALVMRMHVSRQFKNLVR
jgi:hypothetical protein